MRKGKDQLPAGYMHADHLFQCTIAAGFFPDIEVMQYLLSVDGNIEKPPPLAIQPTTRAQPGFRKIQFQPVIAILHREDIGQLPQPIPEVLENGQSAVPEIGSAVQRWLA